MSDITHQILVNDRWVQHEDGTYEKFNRREDVLIQVVLSEHGSPSAKMYTIVSGDDFNHYEPVKAIPNVNGIADLRNLVKLFLN